MINMILLIRFLIFTGIFSVFHPVHVSVSSMEIETEKPAIRLSVRLYKQDIEYAFAHRYDRELSVSELTDEEKTLINQYFNSGFILKNNENPVQFVLTDNRPDEELFWLFYSASPGELSDSLIIENRLLLDLYFDQKNLFILSVNGVEKGYTFDYQTQRMVLDLKEFK